MMSAALSCAVLLAFSSTLSPRLCGGRGQGERGLVQPRAKSPSPCPLPRKAGGEGQEKPQNPPRPFAIIVVDDQTGRGVPLVELRTVNNIRLVTDNNGVVAFGEPGLMNQRVFFHVSSHGYEFPKDGFGIRGQALQISPGSEATLRIKRINIAERLYRVTGGGIYRDSLLAGRKVPLKEPALDSQVLGSDSVLNGIYRGKIYWFWGDTNRPTYPLVKFHVTGAPSEP